MITGKDEADYIDVGKAPELGSRPTNAKIHRGTQSEPPPSLPNHASIPQSCDSCLNRPHVFRALVRVCSDEVIRQATRVE